MSSITQIGEARLPVSLVIAIALFVVVLGVAIASAYFLDAPPFDPALVGP